MIHRLHPQSAAGAKEILATQTPSYREEAKWIQSDAIPYLRDTVETIMECGETFYGYREEGSLIGFISYKKDHHIVDIHRLVVHPDHFRKGIGRLLLQYLLNHEKQTGTFIVQTGSKNIPAKKLYITSGFQEKSTITVEPGVSLTRFEKVLPPST